MNERPARAKWRGVNSRILPFVGIAVMLVAGWMLFRPDAASRGETQQLSGDAAGSRRTDANAVARNAAGAARVEPGAASREEMPQSANATNTRGESALAVSVFDEARAPIKFWSTAMHPKTPGRSMQSQDLERTNEFEYTGIRSGDWELVVAARGYVTSRQLLTFAGKSQRVEVLLKRDPRIIFVQLLDSGGRRLAKTMEKDAAAMLVPHEITVTAIPAADAKDRENKRVDLLGLSTVDDVTIRLVYPDRRVLPEEYDGWIQLKKAQPVDAVLLHFGAIVETRRVTPENPIVAFTVDFEKLAKRNGSFDCQFRPGPGAPPVTHSLVTLEGDQVQGSRIERRMNLKEDGKVHFDDMPPGRWTMTLRGDSVPWHVREFTIETGANTNLGIIQLGAGCAISGVLLGVDGAPGYASLEYLIAGGGAGELIHVTTTNSNPHGKPQGIFTFEGLPAGKGFIVASARVRSGSGGRAVVPVDVNENGIQSLEVRLRPMVEYILDATELTGAVEVEVIDEANIVWFKFPQTPLAQPVRSWFSEGRYVFRLTDASNRQASINVTMGPGLPTVRLAM